MNCTDVMAQLEALGNPSTKKVLINHGASEPLFGVNVGNMKPIARKIKKNHQLSLDLYDTGNGDAMYLAGLIADESQISKEELDQWALNAPYYMISEYTVPWVAAESKYGWDLALEWIESPIDKVATSGWATLSSLASIKNDAELDIVAYQNLLNRVGETIHQAPDRVRYTMNGFVIACGSFIQPLSNYALDIAHTIGKVNVNMGDTACKVPLATAYINKIANMGRVGIKRKEARC